MNIRTIKRPWVKQGYVRTNPDLYYQSNEWKRIVSAIWIRDRSLCQMCLEKGIIHGLERGTRDINKQGTVDHKVQRKKGGTDNEDNLWLIGSNHHASKSANEGNITISE